MTTGMFAGLWDVVSCSNKEKYICKKLADGVQTTTIPPTTPALSCASGWTPVGGRRSVCFKVGRKTEIICEKSHFKCMKLIIFFLSLKRFTKIRNKRRLGRKQRTFARPLVAT